MILESLRLAETRLAEASLALAPPTCRLVVVVIATPVLRKMLRISSRPSSELASRLRVYFSFVCDDARRGVE